ncbi:MAG: aminoacyl-tRNA hydrolase [Proteobacteria bacterium]|nr:aminoacyl-tRNA hydrolase [Pseudomonadota bacterium]
MKRLVIGLGNPGDTYRHTRHNIGFVVADRLAELLKKRFAAGKGEYSYFECDVEKHHLIVAKPTTYMNLIGRAVAELIDLYNIDETKMMVICDDLNLPFGQIRIRERGSSGGHKGLESIIYSLENDRFPRLRVGIGCPEDSEAKDYVLEKFGDDEKAELNGIVNDAAKAVLEWVNRGIVSAMNRYNVKLTH